VISTPSLILAIGILALGLWADIHVELPGQLAIGAAVWALLLAMLSRLPAGERRMFLACVAIATAGELFLSLVWGLYIYRLENVPMFVPPGHALMLMLGLALSRRLPETAARCIIGAAGLYAVVAALTGLDTLALPLFLVLLLAALSLPGHTRLFASTFLLCLGLELYGTALGNWFWQREVPWIGLVTTNPPGIAGAFYAALDALTLAVLAIPVATRRRETALAAG
jgi:hypothetical protein